MTVFIASETGWLDHIHSRIESVFLRQLTHRNRFCELHIDDGGGKRPVGMWGWNTWCGTHDLTPLVDDSLHDVMRNTFDEALARTERGTGLLPHAIPIDRDGRIGFRDGREATTYRTYSGVHGEDYCLDNIICWAKMMLEFFLYTRDTHWFTLDRLRKVEASTNHILENMRSAYDPVLIESGTEGDWTENSDWHADNSNNNVCMVQCLDQLIQVEDIFGRTRKRERYETVAMKMREHFRQDASQGGFWLEDRCWFLHGNDGTGRRVYGDRYFESTANFYSILWGIATRDQRRAIWSYVDAHPEIENPLPVLTNHLPRNSARRMNYGQTITDGDIWLTLGAHAATARLRSGFIPKATAMYKAIIDYELQMGTIHNSIFQNGTVDDVWSPEIGNYGSIFTPLVEGILGLHPRADGLLIDPRPLTGMTKLRMLEPLTYAGKHFYLNIAWKGGPNLKVELDDKGRDYGAEAFILEPDFPDGHHVDMTYS